MIPIVQLLKEKPGMLIPSQGKRVPVNIAAMLPDLLIQVMDDGPKPQPEPEVSAPPSAPRPEAPAETEATASAPRPKAPAEPVARPSARERRALWMDGLRELKRLKDEGILDDWEFQLQKKKLLEECN